MNEREPGRRDDQHSSPALLPPGVREGHDIPGAMRTVVYCPITAAYAGRRVKSQDVV